jgi:hypothetical protein
MSAACAPLPTPTPTPRPSLSVRAYAHTLASASDPAARARAWRSALRAAGVSGAFNAEITRFVLAWPSTTVPTRPSGLSTSASGAR